MQSRAVGSPLLHHRGPPKASKLKPCNQADETSTQSCRVNSIMLEISHEAPVNRKESDLQGRCETFICYCSLGPRETASHRALDEFGLGEKRDLGNQPGPRAESVPAAVATGAHSADSCWFYRVYW